MFGKVDFHFTQPRAVFPYSMCNVFARSPFFEPAERGDFPLSELSFLASWVCNVIGLNVL